MSDAHEPEGRGQRPVLDLRAPQVDESVAAAARLTVWALTREIPHRKWVITGRGGAILAASAGLADDWGRGTTLAHVELQDEDTWLAISTATPDLLPTSVEGVTARAVALLVQSVISSDRRRRIAESAVDEAWSITFVDPVTQLQNGRGWWARLSEVQAAHDEVPGLVIVRVRVVNLREINQQQGHLHGDLLLRLVADHLVAVLPPTAFAARLDAGDFAVLVPEVEPEEFEVRLRDAVSIDGVQVQIGVAAAEGGEPIRTTVARADLSLHNVIRLR